MTNKKIHYNLLIYGSDLKHHCNIYKFLFFIFKRNDPIIPRVNTIFLTVFFKDTYKIINTMKFPCLNEKLKANNSILKVIKRNAFNFYNFENFKNRILITLHIKKERTK